jgi:hypothetical protein
VRVALPVLPSLVAVIFTDPAATAVITPVEGSTLATAVLSELHAMERPINSRPLASRVVPVAWAVPTAVIEFGVKATVTDATGTCIAVNVALPLLPSLVAVMVADPAATALTSPVLGSTFATERLLELQAITRPVSALPLASRGVAIACVF